MFKEKVKSLFTFRWQPNRDTLIVVLLGLLVIGVSSLLLFFNDFNNYNHIIGFFIIRDIVQITILGIVIPLWYILFKKNEKLSDYGINLNHWKRNLIISIVLTILFFFQFLSESGGKMGQVFTNSNVIGPVVYLLLVPGIFEVFFYYAFIRTIFERAFGIIPAVILTAIMYSFHHIGFQPEFGKLIFVGILYASIFRMGGNFLIIYPLFWLLGASWDVLVQSQAKGLENLYIYIWPRAIITSLLIGAISLLSYKYYRKLKTT